MHFLLNYYVLYAVCNNKNFLFTEVHFMVEIQDYVEYLPNPQKDPYHLLHLYPQILEGTIFVTPITNMG